MKKIFLVLLSALLCFFILLTAAGCYAYDEKINGGSESSSDYFGTGISTDDNSAETQKKTEKKTEKRTEKKTEKQTEPQKKLTVKFASYNIYHGGNNSDLKKIAANIKDNGIDVVGLQEVDNGVKRSGKVNQAQKLSQLTGLNYYAFFKAISLDGGSYGLAILSRYPIEKSNTIKLSSASSEQRVLGHSVINADGEKINFFVTHLSYDGESGGASRSKQFSEVASELAKYDNFVLSGDFNTRNLDEYSVISGSALVNLKEDPKITYPDGRSPLDNLVYSTSAWSFNKINVITESYSDHYMIFAQATYKK